MCGGSSSEREVSIQSGGEVARALRDEGGTVEIMDLNEETLDRLQAFKPRVAFLALHGGRGEDGGVQRVLEERGIPFTGSGSRASLLAMDKEIAKTAFHQLRLRTPKACFLHAGAGVSEVNHAVRELGLPLVVKPTADGSSRGVSIAKTRLEVLRGLEAAFALGRRAMLEAYVPGPEINAAVLDGEVLPLVEVRPRHEFFSYEAKYESDETQYIIDPPLRKRQAEEIRRMARSVFNAFGCRHLARIEFLIGPAGLPTLIEVNTLPGMTSHSLFPMAARAQGLSMRELCWKLAEMAL